MIHLFEVHNSVALSMFTELRKPHHHQFPIGKLIPINSHSPSLSSSPSQGHGSLILLCLYGFAYSGHFIQMESWRYVALSLSMFWSMSM